MEFHEVGNHSNCPISYMVELTAKSVGKGKNPLQKAGSFTTVFHRENPIDSRKEAFALAEGWNVKMQNEGEYYLKNDYDNEAQIQKKHYRNYRAFQINVYCIVNAIGTTEKKLLLERSGDVYKQKAENLVWEYDRYQEYNLTNPNYLDWLSDEWDGYRVVFTEFDTIELKDVDRPEATRPSKLTIGVE